MNNKYSVPRQIQDKAQNIRLILLDVDGVLTDGKIYFDSNGIDHKSFYIPDGAAIRMAMRAGLEIIFISGRRSKDVEKRAQELGVTENYKKITNKSEFLDHLFKKKNLNKKNIAAVGDDLLDLQVFARASLRIAVNNAASELKEKADYVTRKNGGNGAVREFIDLLLKAMGKWEEVTERYYKDIGRK